MKHKKADHGNTNCSLIKNNGNVMGMLAKGKIEKASPFRTCFGNRNTEKDA